MEKPISIKLHWNIPILSRKYIFIHGWFSIVMLVFGVGKSLPPSLGKSESLTRDSQHQKAELREMMRESGTSFFFVCVFFHLPGT